MKKGLFSRLFSSNKPENIDLPIEKHNSQQLLGSWILKWFINPANGERIPAIDQIAPTDSYLTYWEDGSYRHIKFFEGKPFRLDPVNRVYLHEEDALFLSSGTWKLNQDKLTEKWENEDPGEVTVRIVSLTEDELIIEEPAEMGIALQVIYTRIGASGSDGSAEETDPNKSVDPKSSSEVISKLADELLTMGAQFIESGDQHFTPLAISMNLEGSLQNEIMLPAPGTSASQVCDQLIAAIAKDKENLMAAGICTSNYLDSIGTFIVASVQHRDLTNISFVWPYQIDEAGNVAFHKDVFPQKGAYHFFD